MSFLKKLFGWGSSGEGEQEAGAPAKSVEYNGFKIHAAPYKSEGQYQTAGMIEKQIEGVLQTHRFVRADRVSAFDEAVEFALGKGRQIIDEQGERIFK